MHARHVFGSRKVSTSRKDETTTTLLTRREGRTDLTPIVDDIESLKYRVMTGLEIKILVLVSVSTAWFRLASLVYGLTDAHFVLNSITSISRGFVVHGGAFQSSRRYIWGRIACFA